MKEVNVCVVVPLWINILCLGNNQTVQQEQCSIIFVIIILCDTYDDILSDVPHNATVGRASARLIWRFIITGVLTVIINFSCKMCTFCLFSFITVCRLR